MDEDWRVGRRDEWNAAWENGQRWEQEPTFDDELVVEDPLERPEEESVERQVADFPRLEVAVDLFERFAPLEGLFQFLQYQPVLFDVPMIQLWPISRKEN